MAGIAEFGEHWTAAHSWQPTYHRHRSWQFLLLLDGCLTWDCDAGEAAITAGGWLLLAPDQRRRVVAAAGDRQHLVYAVVDPGGFFRRFPGHRPRWEERRLHVGSSAPELAQCMRLLSQEVQRDGTDEAMSGCLLELLCLQISRALSAEGRACSAIGLPPVVTEGRRLLEAHADESWTVARLAKRLACSPSLVAHAFSATLGISPMRLLTQIRCGMARELLGDSDLSVTAIAQECGFSSSQHLATAFRKQYGGSPSDWRRLQQGRSSGGGRGSR